MSKKISQQTQDKIYQTILLYPSKTNLDISKEFNVSDDYVGKIHKKFTKAQDTELIRNAAGMFLSEFQTCSDRLKSYISELEELKEGKKTIQRNNMSTGKIETKIIKLEPLDIAALIKLQIDATKQILHMAAQPRLITIIRAMRDQKFKKPDFNE